ncbi:MAG: helix-turn-helix domain-containing protein [Desulfovibrio fairfieldensis]
MVEKANNFDVQFERILKATGSSSDAELARKLGISPPSVTGAKQRRSIPLTWLKTVAEVYGASLDWLMTGKGSQPLVALAKAMERRAAEISEEMPGQPDYVRKQDATGGISRLEGGHKAFICAIRL